MKDKDADTRQAGVLTRVAWETCRETKVYDKQVYTPYSLLQQLHRQSKNARWHGTAF